VLLGIVFFELSGTKEKQRNVEEWEGKEDMGLRGRKRKHTSVKNGLIERKKYLSLCNFFRIQPGFYFYPNFRNLVYPE